MTIDDIKTLIASGESQTLELKKSTGELKDGMHSACAFLNTEGGWLIFGIIASPRGRRHGNCIKKNRNFAVVSF